MKAFHKSYYLFSEIWYFQVVNILSRKKKDDADIHNGYIFRTESWLYISFSCCSIQIIHKLELVRWLKGKQCFVYLFIFSYYFHCSVTIEQLSWYCFPAISFDVAYFQEFSTISTCPRPSLKCTKRLKVQKGLLKAANYNTEGK